MAAPDTQPSTTAARTKQHLGSCCASAVSSMESIPRPAVGPLPPVAQGLLGCGVLQRLDAEELERLDPRPGPRRPADRVALGPVSDSVGWPVALGRRAGHLHGDGQAVCRPPPTSPRLPALVEAVFSGAHDEAIQDVTMLARPALAATAIDVLGADGYLLGTPANLGSMSGALQYFSRPDLLSLSGGDRAAALWAVGPRRQRHHRCGAGGGGDHPGSGMAPCPGSGGRAWRPEPGGPPGLLGA
jgi:hypothetical protein